MSAQPEALRLAEILEGDYCPDWFYEIGVDEVCAELRRLHAGIEAEREARQAAQIENEALKARIARADVELQRAVIAEREACAQVCERFEIQHWRGYKDNNPATRCNPHTEGLSDGAGECAAAIRARGAA